MFLTNLLLTIMSITMPTLPYANNALEPVISEQTIDFHYGKHLQNYVNTLNTLIQGTEFEGKSVEDIVKAAPDGPIFNNAGQTLNHILYFLQQIGYHQGTERRQSTTSWQQPHFGNRRLGTRLLSGLPEPSR